MMIIGSEKQNLCLNVDELEWYHPCLRCRQAEKRGRIGHPR